MIEEKWQQLVEMAQADFDDVLYYTDDIVVEDRGDHFKDGTQDVLEFSNARGRFKVVKVNRLNMAPKMLFYKDNFGEWEAVNPENLDEIF